MMKKDYYGILDVNRTADAAAIKRAYRKLAKEYHPDSNTGNVQAEERSKELNEAYDILGDEKQQELYDQCGHTALDEIAGAYESTESNSFGNGPHYAYGGMNNGYHEYHFEGGKDMDDILEHIFRGSGAFHRGTASGFRGNRFNKTYSRHGFLEKGADVQGSIEVSFDKAVFGCKRIVRLQDENGQVQSMEIIIPADVADGKVIRLKGKGMDGANGGGSGNLLLNITVRDKPEFRRDGQNVHTTVTIPFATAVLGSEVKVPTIYGDVICKIKTGTQSESQIRLKGKGIVTPGNPAIHGDQYVTVEMQVPKNLTPEVEQELGEFEQLCNEAGKDAYGGYAA